MEVVEGGVDWTVETRGRVRRGRGVRVGVAQSRGQGVRVKVSERLMKIMS